MTLSGRTTFRAASPESLAQEGEDPLGVQLQEAGLVGAGGMEDEVPEAQLDIGPDALDLLLDDRRRRPRRDSNSSSSS